MAIGSLVLYSCSAYPPLSFIQGQNPWIDGFVNAGVFVLLALGLNIVVGLAGLLDLGYAAFFAIGAYTYAYGASPVHRHRPAVPLPCSSSAQSVAAMFGIALGAPTLRLRGDYLAIVTLGFGEIVPIVFLNADEYTQRHERHRRHRPPEHLPVFGEFTGLDQLSVLRPDGRHRHDHDDPPVPAPGFPDRAGLDGHPRGRARGGGERHQHGRRRSSLAFALGATTAGLRRRVQRLEADDRRSRTSSCSPCRSRSWRWSSSAAWATSGASPSARSSSTSIQNVLLKQLNAFFDNLPFNVPDPDRHRLRAVPVPAVRHRAGADDAAQARGPLPEPAPASGAPCHGEEAAAEDAVGRRPGR